MPYVCRVTISGPEPDADGVDQMMDAVANAIEAGWSAPRIVVDSVDDDEGTVTPDGPSDDDPLDGTILDYRVLGYPGGAIILVVLDDVDLMQTSVAVTGLARHLTTWSPGLLEYSPDEISISKLDEPYGDGNWLPPVDDADDDSERPRWHLAELLDSDLQDLASEYLLALAIRSLWNPTDPVEGRRARDVVLGAVEDPWGRELMSALGPMLVRAARLELRTGDFSKLVVQGAGSPELAADLLRRARETGPETETDGWDDEMRGHVLVEKFMAEHQLLWNRGSDGESSREYESRSISQLRELLWAGLRAVATMAMGLADLSGPWQVLDRLGGGTVVSVLAEREETEHEDAVAEDLEDVESAAGAHALAWLSIWRPELLDTPAAGSLIELVTLDVSAFHQVFYAAMVMAGSGPLRAALQDRPAPARWREGITDFVDALAMTEDGDEPEADDAYDDMHRALEEVLEDGPDLDERIRYLLAVAGNTARLTESDVNPRRADDEYVSTPGELTRYLLLEPAMHAVTMLHRHDDDEAIRARMLSLAAEVEPAAAGRLAADFPDLTGDDPRLEPASRARAQRWIENAMRAVRTRGAVFPPEALKCGADALLLLNAVSAGQEMPADWPVDRLTAAGAEGAAAALHAIGEPDLAEEVFDDQG